jgi:metal-responsive CopG/Arc/MetJ family transcriptional regulator
MTKRPRLMILLPSEMLAEIDEHVRAEPDILTRTEAIRRLIRVGLDAARRATEKRRAA